MIAGTKPAKMFTESKGQMFFALYVNGIFYQEVIGQRLRLSISRRAPLWIPVFKIARFQGSFCLRALEFSKCYASV
jgi:hypothetical protein